MAKKNRISSHIDVACVIHSDKYQWIYVERLYNMVSRMLSKPVRFHVYTEHSRSVPPHMIKHCLETWPGVSGPKKSWWYKMHLFNPEHHDGPLLYFDLDCVIVRSIDWIWQLPPERLWCIRDFKYLQSSFINMINSSVMWWDTQHYQYVWQEFVNQGVNQVVARYQGDQDFIHATVPANDRRYFEDKMLQSYRWQVEHGGYDFQKRKHVDSQRPDLISGDCSIIVFHGSPKPHEVRDKQIVELWQ